MTDEVWIITGHWARPGVYITGGGIRAERGVKPGDTFTKETGSAPFKREVVAVYESWDEAWAAYQARP